MERYAEMVREVRRASPDFVAPTGDLVYGDFHSEHVDREAVRRDWDAVHGRFSRSLAFPCTACRATTTCGSR